MTNKTALLDASSAILLYKAGLHELLTDMFNIAVPETVFHEITDNYLPGAKEFINLVSSNKITIINKVSSSLNETGTSYLTRFGKGERDLIRMYYAGLGSFIITDDGAAAKYCKQKQIPFINALLFPVVLKYCEIRNHEFCNQAMSNIIKHGRYSPTIISWAQNCTKEDLSFVLKS